MPKRDLSQLISNSQPDRPAINRGQGFVLSTNSPEPVVEEVQPVKKVGRPKGPARTKKTVYFYHPENIEKIKKALALHADLWIDEESEIVDLALAVVAKLISDGSEVKTITGVYEAVIKLASQK
jgi:hypothetical protein